eukprot:TRINITY_DN1063_c0_g1_i1.p2 TRINITY_DN1063_c0_g1~~TRINITY_DN1063_c0_g1_i1.p2  ORF type:complete len:319 (-),score=122.89 TRINITY_DN1063_c0_g1_i1:71-988(-)
MKIHVQSRSGKPLGTLTLPNDADVPALKSAYAKQTPSMYVDRQRFYLPAVVGAKPVALGDKATLAAAGIADGGTVVFKDLGPQISWKAVFVLEYLGPLLILPTFLLAQRAIYGRVTPPGSVAAEHQVALALAWGLHYAKREFETLCVHRFSHATMPLSNLAKNCGYYWGFAAAVAYFAMHPLYTPASEAAYISGLVGFYFMEAGNMWCHYKLRALRPAGSTVRRIPVGGPFTYVSCPNYTCEIGAWVAFNVACPTVWGWAFAAAGAAQMAVWAAGKHRNYRKEFDGKDGRPLYPRSRKALIPFIW